jgi:transposase
VANNDHEVTRAEAPRIVEANRKQLELRTFDLEATLPSDHRARAIWAVVERLDLSLFYDAIRARGSQPGRAATDPKVLVALWVYATAEGVGSARQLDRLCKTDDAYRWICGGVPVNHHTLSDFRVDHAAAVDELMSQVLAVLMKGKLVRLHRVAHDGMRLRASAGAASFRREKTLQDLLELARTQVSTLKEEIAQDPAEHVARQRAAQARAAADRQRAIEKALRELPKVQAVKARNRGRKRGKKSASSEARVSTTDPEARVMKMADGGFRPAYNVQIATDVDSRAIVGLDVVNSGSDMGQAVPMLEEIERRTGTRPQEYLVDGGFADLESIDEMAARGVTIYAPPMKPARPRAPGSRPRRRDSAAQAAWRARMDTDDAKVVYRQRASTAETVNADLRCWRGLDRIRVRGKSKVRTVAMWSAVTYNVLRWLAAERAAA